MITATCHPEVIEATEAALAALHDQLEGDGGGDGNDLAADLYQWYVNLVEPEPRTSRRLEAIDLTPATALHAAHAGARCFGSGWTVAERAGLLACRAVHTDGYERWLQPGQFRADRGTRLAPGDPIQAERAWTWVEEETGFWLTRNGVWTPEGASELARIYVNATPRQALQVVEGVTRLLLRHDTSFVMKTSAVPHQTGRADSLVIYLGRPDFDQLRDAVVEIAAARPTGAADVLDGSPIEPLRTAVPRFTEELAPGVAWGAGRLDGESFGKLRCDTIAATVLAHQTVGFDRLVELVAHALAEVGVDPDAPHRHTGVQ